MPGSFPTSESRRRAAPLLPISPFEQLTRLRALHISISAADSAFYLATRPRCKMRPQLRRRRSSRHITLYQELREGTHGGRQRPDQKPGRLRQLILPIHRLRTPWCPSSCPLSAPCPGCPFPPRGPSGRFLHFGDTMNSSNSWRPIRLLQFVSQYSSAYHPVTKNGAVWRIDTC
jgi:hypothetical protein